MRLLSLLFLFATTVVAKTTTTKPPRAYQNVAVSQEMDCAIRTLALEYAEYIQPTLGSYRSIFDGLELHTLCNQTPPSHVETDTTRMDRVKPNIDMDKLDASSTIYVSPSGSDSNDGSFGAPVQTIAKAIRISRSYRDDGSQYTIMLRAGVYELKQKIALTQTDSGLVITSYPGESVLISGGRTLTNLTWTTVNTTQNIISTQLPSDILLSSNALNQMWVNGKRQIRARYPNGDPEVQGLHTTPTGYVNGAKSWIPPKTNIPKATEVVVTSLNREGYFPQYQMGISGPASVFTPPTSFWALANPPGGGGATYVIPQGLTYDPATFSSHVASWKKPTEGLVHAFHNGHWGNWMFTIDHVNATSNTIYFGRGGIQEARGSNAGAEFYVENILEELDSPGEWYVDSESGILYYYANSTDFNPEITVSQIPYLISIDGTKEHPAKDIHITGITFSYTSSTFMREYAVPSAGDWSIHLGAAIMTKGVERVKIDYNLFQGIGGNAVLIHGYSRNTVIDHNEMVWIGDSGVVMIGEFSGIDTHDGYQPFDTTISYNLIHEIGIWGKQVSPIIQALTARSTIIGNILFNVPRAGINFNDGFGGGSLVKNNLVFNTVRETADHGPFNSWDRLPFLNQKHDKDDIPSLVPKMNNIVQNFLINNYHAVWPIDHDDGSCYFTDAYNFMAYGGWKNYLGHDRTVTNNIYLFPDSKRSSPLTTPHISNAHTSPHTPHHAMRAVKNPYINPLDAVHINPDRYDQYGDYFIEPFCCQTTYPRLGVSGFGDSWQNNTCALSISNIIYQWDDTYVDPKTGLQNLVPLSDYNQFYLDPAMSPPVVHIRDQVMTLADYAKSLNLDTHSQSFGLVTPAQVTAWGKALLWKQLPE